MKQESRWQPTTRQRLAGLSVLIVALLVIAGYSAEWTGLPEQTVWDWLELLIVPAVIAAGGIWFNRRQQQREQEAAYSRERERVAQEAAQRERELEVENQRAQDEAFQAYLGQMSQLLTDKERPLHGVQPGDTLSTLARARTLTVLTQLDDNQRRGNILRFLAEAELIRKDHPIFSLRGADLSGASLIRANLHGTDLREVVLDGADLRDADLSGADLSKARLMDADVRGARLNGAKLVNADLKNMRMNDAILNSANLRFADFKGTDMSGSFFELAILRRAKNLTNEQLNSTHTLFGATMPNGQKYEEWLENREGRGEDRENSG